MRPLALPLSLALVVACGDGTIVSDTAPVQGDAGGAPGADAGRDDPGPGPAEDGTPAGDGEPAEGDGSALPERDAAIPAPRDGGTDEPPPPPPPPLDVTFFVVSDTHVDPLSGELGHPDRDSNFGNQATVAAVRRVAREGSWPAVVDNQATGFVGGPIGEPRAVVLAGDITGWGVAGTEIPAFRHYYEAGYAAGSLPFPAYVGLGNHDVDDADRSGDWAAHNRNAYWQYVHDRHAPGGPVATTSFDEASSAYSFDLGGVHVVQLHRFGGDTGYGRASSLPFLERDLAAHANDGRPVFLVHHYGMDPFGTQDRWWTQAQRDAYRDTLAPYNVAGIMVGHSHAAFDYDWEGHHVFHTNSAKAENGTGNNDGNGSFSIVRITDTQLDWVTCRWLDGEGRFELVGPFFSGPVD